MRSLLLVTCCALLTSGAAWAEMRPSPTCQQADDGVHDFSSGAQGYDINLRHTFSTSTAWLGFYNENDGFDQVRAGYSMTITTTG